MIPIIIQNAVTASNSANAANLLNHHAVKNVTPLLLVLLFLYTISIIFSLSVFLYCMFEFLDCKSLTNSTGMVISFILLFMFIGLLFSL